MDEQDIGLQSVPVKSRIDDNEILVVAQNPASASLDPGLNPCDNISDVQSYPSLNSSMHHSDNDEKPQETPDTDNPYTEIQLLIVENVTVDASETNTTCIDVAGSVKKESEGEKELHDNSEGQSGTSLLQIGSNEENPSSKSPECNDSDKKRSLDITPSGQPRRKRGRKPVISDLLARQEEDVCFVCFDGGDLILCDKRSCPKAYHMECTGRESDYFRQKGQWLCGWHVCAICGKSATVHCYTCPNAYCNNCVKEADYLAIRRDKGLCEACFPIVYMIENNLTINSEGVEVDFNDEETYECLYKGYWKDLKETISMTWSEIEKASKAKDAGEALFDSHVDDNDGESTDSGRKPVTRQSKRLKRKRSTTRNAVIEVEDDSDHEEDDEDVDDEENSKQGRQKGCEFVGWASKELIDFLQSLGQETNNPLPLPAIRKLLHSYIETNNLINPRQRGQVKCDEKLQKLFGKKNVGKYEMMKIVSKKMISAKGQEIAPDSDDDEDNDSADDRKPRQRKARKKGDEIKPDKPDTTAYAAIDVKNINLIYLKRNLLEDMRDDPELESKVIGSFVRIRVTGNKNDSCHRLVQVVGVKKVPNVQDPSKPADVVLDILNLTKREEVNMETISTQDFTEEECQRLRQSVKLGLLKAMTVADLQDRARALKQAKVKDYLETEILRLSHLRDRASEKGRKKELRECVEKIQLLSSSAEKQRQLNAPLEINTDPQLDPDYESDNSPDQDIASKGSDQKQCQNTTFEKPVAAGYAQPKGILKKDDSWGGNPLEGRKDDQWMGPRHVETHNQVSNRSTVVMMKDESTRQNSAAWQKSGSWEPEGGREIRVDDGWGGSVDSGKNTYAIENLGKGNSNDDDRWGNAGPKANDIDWKGNVRSGEQNVSFGWKGDTRSCEGNGGQNVQMKQQNNDATQRGDFGMLYNQTKGVQAGGAASHPDFVGATTAVNNEKEKIWHYQDPSKTIQGPFSMEQLRRWEKTKLFPLDLHIWRTTESQEDSILLTDALQGKFTRNVNPASSTLGGQNIGGSSQIGWRTPASEVEFRNPSMAGSGRSGSSWPERSGRPVWDQDGFDNRVDMSAHGNNRGTESHTNIPDRGIRPERAWGTSHTNVPGKPAPQEGGRDGSFRGNWGRGANVKDSGNHHRFNRSNSDRFPTKKKEVPCRFYARGMCKKGQDCDFKHD